MASGTDELTPEMCVRGAEAAKEAGNAQLRQDRADLALAKYREGLELCGLYYRKTRLKAKEKELQQRATSIYILLHLNAAQVSLKLLDWDSAVSHADRVLQIDHQNLKALYRRAVARSHADSTLQQACEDFARVLQLDPLNKEAQDHLQRTQEKMQTFYDILGAHPDFTSSQLRQAYLREARRWHPDKAADADKELADRRFKLIAEAHEVLQNEQAREQYDLYLMWRPRGFVEFEDPENPHGPGVRLAFQDWADFRRLMEQATSSDLQEELCRRSGRAPRQEEPQPDDPDDPPLSVGEWMLAGGVCLALWCFFGWRHSRRQWLKAMPLEIWTMHEEYAMPLGLLLSPLFFGNVPIDEATKWLSNMVNQALKP